MSYKNKATPQNRKLKPLPDEPVDKPNLEQIAKYHKLPIHNLREFDDNVEEMIEWLKEHDMNHEMINHNFYPVKPKMNDYLPSEVGQTFMNSKNEDERTHAAHQIANVMIKLTHKVWPDINSTAHFVPDAEYPFAAQHHPDPELRDHKNQKYFYFNGTEDQAFEFKLRWL